MIQGKSTIQLFDAVTGQEVIKVINKNMVMIILLHTIHVL